MHGGFGTVEYKLVSVIMGIYNCCDTLKEAVECIINQTYTHWELIMCDDASTDNTYEIAEQYASLYPERIVLLKNEKNYGLNYTLNRCLKIAKGEFIARMDGDDLCAVTRFQEELEVFEQEKNIDIVSTGMEYFDEKGVWGKILKKEYPDKNDFLTETPFCHAPCMVRKKAYDTVNGYSESKYLLRVEDYHLWLKMIQAGFKGKNIQKCLYQMRDDREAFSRRKFRYRINEVYVRMLAVKQLHLAFYGYILALKPLLVGILPQAVYNYLHRKRLKQN